MATATRSGTAKAAPPKPSTQLFAYAVLHGIGAPPSQENLAYINAQAAAENTRATNNPLATTQPYNGATDFNSVGVKNFKSFQDGVAATVQTLLNGYYDGIVGDLRSNNYSATQIASRNASELSTWGTGAQAVAQNVGKTSDAAYSGQPNLSLSGAQTAGFGSDFWKAITGGIGGTGIGAAPGGPAVAAIPDAFKKLSYALAIGGGGVVILLGLLLIGIDLGLGAFESARRSAPVRTIAKLPPVRNRSDARRDTIANENRVRPATRSERAIVRKNASRRERDAKRAKRAIDSKYGEVPF